MPSIFLLLPLLVVLCQANNEPVYPACILGGTAPLMDSSQKVVGAVELQVKNGGVQISQSTSQGFAVKEAQAALSYSNVWPTVGTNLDYPSFPLKYQPAEPSQSFSFDTMTLHPTIDCRNTNAHFEFFGAIHSIIVSAAGPKEWQVFVKPTVYCKCPVDPESLTAHFFTVSDQTQGHTSTGTSSGQGSSSMVWIIVGVVVGVIALFGILGAWCYCSRQPFLPFTEKLPVIESQNPLANRERNCVMPSANLCSPTSLANTNPNTPHTSKKPTTPSGSCAPPTPATARYKQALMERWQTGQGYLRGALSGNGGSYAPTQEDLANIP